MSSEPIVFFIHGLSTFGDDQIHLGPLVLGPMYQKWKPFLESQGCEFIVIDEMGIGSFEDQVDRAVLKIERHLGQRAPGESVHHVHLFGHSFGGLVARGAGARLLESTEFISRSKLCSIITLGTAHQGTTATGDALDLEKNFPRTYQVLKHLGYDIRERREALSYFTIDRIKAFADRHPLLEGVECVSLIGAASRKQLGLPFQLIFSRLHSDPNALTDGLVSAASQEWARIGGRFALDHGGELGVFSNALPWEWKQATNEFERLKQTVLEIIESSGDA